MWCCMFNTLLRFCFYLLSTLLEIRHITSIFHKKCQNNINNLKTKNKIFVKITFEISMDQNTFSKIGQN